jgi:hypothetical protein
MADKSDTLNKLSTVMEKNLVYTQAQFDLSRDLAQQSQKVAKATNKSLDRVADNLDHIVQKVNTASDKAETGSSIEGNFKDWIKDFGKKAAENQTEVFTTSGKLIKKGERGFELAQSAYNKRTQDALKRFEQNQAELADSMQSGMFSEGLKMLGDGLKSGAKSLKKGFDSFAQGDVFGNIGAEFGELFGTAVGTQFKDIFKKMQAVVMIPVKLITAPIKLLAKGIKTFASGGIFGKLKMVAFLALGIFAFTKILELYKWFQKTGLSGALVAMQEIMQKVWYAVTNGIDKLLLRWNSGDDAKVAEIQERMATRDVNRAETILTQQGITMPDRNAVDMDKDGNEVKRYKDGEEGNKAFELDKLVYLGKIIAEVPNGLTTAFSQTAIETKFDLKEGVIEGLNNTIQTGKENILGTENSIVAGVIEKNKEGDRARVEVNVDTSVLPKGEDGNISQGTAIAAELMSDTVEVSAKTLDLGDGFFERTMKLFAMGGGQSGFAPTFPGASDLNRQALERDATDEEIGSRAEAVVTRNGQRDIDKDLLKEYVVLRNAFDKAGLGDMLDREEGKVVKDGKPIRGNAYFGLDGNKDRTDTLELMKALEMNEKNVTDLIAEFRAVKDAEEKASFDKIPNGNSNIQTQVSNNNSTSVNSAIPTTGVNPNHRAGVMVGVF